MHVLPHRAPSAPVYFEPVVPDLRKKPSPVFALVAAGIGICVLIPFVCHSQHEADQMMDDFKKQDEARDTCKANCKSSCVGAAKDRGTDFDPEMQKTMADTDRELCETQCEMDKDCYQVKQYLNKR